MNISFAFRISLIVLSVSFISFISFIYFEDFTVFAEIRNKTNFSISEETVVNRLLGALLLSFGISAVLYALLARLILSIRKISLMILDWGRDSLNHTDLYKELYDKELNEMKLIFRSALFSSRERDMKRKNEEMREWKENLLHTIQPNLSGLPEEISARLGAAIEPSGQSSPRSDYANTIYTRDGIVSFIAGFESPSTSQTAYFPRFQSVFSCLLELNYLDIAKISHSFLSGFHPYPIHDLRLCMMEWDREKRLLRYLHYQKNPVYFLDSFAVRELPVNGETSYQFDGDIPDFRHFVPPVNGYLITFSDRIRTYRGFQDMSFLIPLEKMLVEKYYEFSDPVILTRQIHSFFFEWQKQKGDAESLAPVRILAIQV